MNLGAGWLASKEPSVKSQKVTNKQHFGNQGEKIVKKKINNNDILAFQTRATVKENLTTEQPV